MNSPDLIGQRYGKLLVTEPRPMPKPTSKKKRYWLCKCDCGGQTIASTGNLNSGNTTSCGCSKRNHRGGPR